MNRSLLVAVLGVAALFPAMTVAHAVPVNAAFSQNKDDVVIPPTATQTAEHVNPMDQNAPGKPQQQNLRPIHQVQYALPPGDVHQEGTMLAQYALPPGDVHQEQAKPTQYALPPGDVHQERTKPTQYALPPGDVHQEHNQFAVSPGHIHQAPVEMAQYALPPGDVHQE